jgi:hypothetical protein
MKRALGVSLAVAFAISTIAAPVMAGTRASRETRHSALTRRADEPAIGGVGA